MLWLGETACLGESEYILANYVVAITLRELE